jgi:hypothetical protein
MPSPKLCLFDTDLENPCPERAEHLSLQKAAALHGTLNGHCSIADGITQVCLHKRVSYPTRIGGPQVSPSLNRRESGKTAGRYQERIDGKDLDPLQGRPASRRPFPTESSITQCGSTQVPAPQCHGLRRPTYGMLSTECTKRHGNGKDRCQTRLIYLLSSCRSGTTPPLRNGERN